MLIAVIAGTAAPLRADSITGTRVLCLGDSLTFGQEGNGVTWPKAFSSLNGGKVINRGHPGYIPRHITYMYFLEDCQPLTVSQLQAIPPKDAEDRINQPTISGTMTFYSDGTTVAVNQNGSPATYSWSSTSTLDDATTIKPNVVGDPSHDPLYTTGRWVRQTAIPTVTPTKPSIAVLWIGANGMEVNDVAESLTTLFAQIGTQTNHIVVIGLINRLGYPSDPAAWAPWINQCNDYIRATYPNNFIDLQAWFTSSGPYAGGGYKTTDWFPNATAQQIANDQSDQARGLVPRLVHGPTETDTHLNAIGYTIVGTLVHQFTQQHLWY